MTWLAFYKAISQAFSWVVTIYVARLLEPSDYGLLAMALFFTEFAAMFSEMGLGYAIIQKKEIKPNELSSVFWFAMGIGILFALSCIPLSYLTAYLFNNDNVISLTQLVAVIFVISGLEVVPLNLLKRQLDFKMVGLIEMTSTIVASATVVSLAYAGWGVWSLIIGKVCLSLVRVVFVYYVVNWRPSLYFNFKEAEHFLKFGMTVAFGRSFYYIFEMSDRFFVGRMFGEKLLGYYSFALQLAHIPTDKIVSVINQVSYSVFSRLQKDEEKFVKFYLDIMKITAILVFPLFVGGFLLGEDLIKVVLNEKWYPIISLFKYLCLVQILTSISVVNTTVHRSLGHPMRGLYYDLAGAVIMPISFYFALQYGFDQVIVPWFTSYVLINVVMIAYTLNKINIKYMTYLSNLMVPILGTIAMALFIHFSSVVFDLPAVTGADYMHVFLFKVLIGAAVYLSYIWIFDRSFFSKIKLLKSN